MLECVVIRQWTIEMGVGDKTGLVRTVCLSVCLSVCLVSSLAGGMALVSYFVDMWSSTQIPITVLFDPTCCADLLPH